LGMIYKKHSRVSCWWKKVSDDLYEIQNFQQVRRKINLIQCQSLFVKKQGDFPAVCTCLAFMLWANHWKSILGNTVSLSLPLHKALWKAPCPKHWKLWSRLVELWRNETRLECRQPRGRTPYYWKNSKENPK
jgi:hypothetical protein